MERRQLNEGSFSYIDVGEKNLETYSRNPKKLLSLGREWNPKPPLVGVESGSYRWEGKGRYHCSNPTAQTGRNCFSSNAWFILPANAKQNFSATFRRSWARFNWCKLFVVNLWRNFFYSLLHSQRKYEPGLKWTVFNPTLLNMLHNLQTFPCRESTHADMIVLISAGWEWIHRGWVGQHLILRHWE